MAPWFLWLILVFNPLARVLANMEGDALHSLKTSLIDPNNVLQSWDPTLVNPCAWFHVTCNSDNSVIRVELGNEQLSGTLVPLLGQLRNLQYLELHSNNISGIIPSDLGNLTSLVSLDLYLNHFTGQIPDTLGRLTNLRFLRLNNNSLTGKIPTVLTTVSALQVLDLSNNDLQGNVPSNGSFSMFTPISFFNNPGLCGPGTSKPCPGAPPFSPPPPFVPPTPLASPGSSASSTGAIAGGVAAGAALLFAAPAIGFAYWRRRKPQEYSVDFPAEEDPEVHLGQLKRFSLRELQVATDVFNNKNILGRGGFGKLYKGQLADGSLVAVKRLREERTPDRELQFQTEVEMIGLVVHRNLLRLRGFCMTPTERLLVHPYMANGSVASRLRERPPSEPPLDLPTRRKIALGSARGLSYLHDHCYPKIIHRDVKAANILLDEEFEAVVGDFGLAILMDYMDTHVTTAVCGTIGHLAPEYLSTGECSEKTDVFGYGIMLLELITGQRAFDLARLANDDDVMLLDWVKGRLKEKKLDMLVDPDLENYIETEVESLIQVALLCTQDSPGERPKMSDVVRMLEGDGLAERWEELQKVEVSRQDYDDTNNLSADELSVVRQDHDSTNDLSTVELSVVRQDHDSTDDLSAVRQDHDSTDDLSTVELSVVRQDHDSNDDLSAVRQDHDSTDDLSTVELSVVRRDHDSTDDLSAVRQDHDSTDDLSAIRQDHDSTDDLSTVELSVVLQDHDSTDDLSTVELSVVRQDHDSADDLSTVKPSVVRQDHDSADDLSTVELSVVRQDHASTDDLSTVELSVVRQDHDSADDLSTVKPSVVRQDHDSADDLSTVKPSVVRQDHDSADDLSTVELSVVRQDHASTDDLSTVELSGPR